MWLEVCVKFWVEWLCEGMRLDFREGTLRRYKATSKALRGNLSLAKQRALVSAKVYTARDSSSFLRSAPVGEVA